MAYTVYVLRSLKDHKRYIGVTSNLARRLREHESGSVESTRNRRPLKLIHQEIFADKKQAWKQEKFLKSGQGREWLDLLEEE